MISLRHWVSATEGVLNLGLPWRVLRPQLVSSTQSGVVDYQQWLQEFSITEPKLEVIECKKISKFASCAFIRHLLLLQISDDSILETMYRNHCNLETIFRIIDTDHSGTGIS